jgi:UDP-N-acetylmuramyl pentapeptide phosphotransferase/UDP-N-acetylglucosamine-1-phosphate transferase
MKDLTSVIAAVVAFAATAGLGYIIIPYLRKLKFGQTILDIGPNWHKEKQGTPTMGGVMMVAGLIIALAVAYSYSALFDGDFATELKATQSLTRFLAGIIMALLMSAIGFMDDYIKVVKKRNLGLTAKQKTFLQLLVAAVYLVTLLLGGMTTTTIPFIGDIDLTNGIGLIFWPIALIFIYGFTNAVNLTDGIDGLASMFAILCLICFGCCYWDSGNLIYSYIASAMVGALIVFLYYNMFGSLEKKTKTFMGDSGSMMLGFSLAYLSIKFICDEDKGSMDVQERMLLCMSLLFVPCIDLFRVVLERLIHGERLFAADKRHIQYKFMSAGIYGRLTLLCVLVMALVIILVNIVLSLCAWGNTYIFITDITLYFVFVCLLNRRIEMYRRTMALRENLGDKFRENASVARKVCILTPRFPIPENGGDVLRINNIARQLKREGYELVLVSFEDDGSPQLFEAERIYDKVYTIHRNRINSLVQSVIHLFLGRAMQCGYYYSAEYKHLLQIVIEKEKPDIYIAHLLRMMPYLDELHLHDRSVIEMTDALSKTYSLSSGSKGGGFLRQVYAIERHLIRRAEQYAMMYFPVNVLVSEADADYLRTISNHN